MIPPKSRRKPNSPSVTFPDEATGCTGVVVAGRAQYLEGFCAPVLHPGSVERTSFAEREETKGYLLVDLAPGREASWRFVPLAARPMYVLSAEEMGRLGSLPPDAVVRVAGRITSAQLRSLAPPTMNVSVSAIRGR